MTVRNMIGMLLIALVLPVASVPSGLTGDLAGIGDQDPNAQVSDAGTVTDKPFPLMVGDAPPALTLGEWLRGDPIDRFEEGHIYVIDFWATWCGPCIQAMPHIAALQDQYAGEVTIIGVNIMEYLPVRVQPFLLKMEETITYSVVLDDVPPNAQAIEGKMVQTWMAPSGYDDLPLSFIIGKDGRIEWIGYSLDMIDPLGAIVEGNWDREAFAREYNQRMQWVAAAEPIRDELEIASEKKKWKEALAACRKLYAIDNTEFASEAAVELNRIAALIVAAPAPSAADLGVALEASLQANEITNWTRIFTISTMAEVHFKQGNLERAIELMEKAMELGDEAEKRHLNIKLEQYSAALEQRK
jgi:thiol-disulfide isomerase/thioredoxin